jgi:hypothetical protein
VLHDATLRAYLLGAAPPEVAERLDERLIEDETVYAAMQAAEEDLLDDFARGRLTGHERGQFLERYGRQPQRILFAQALARRASANRVIPFPRRHWVPLAVAATVILVAGGLLTRNLEAPGPHRTVAPQSSTTPQSLVAVELTLGTSRAAAAPTVVTLPKGTTGAQLRVHIDPADRFDNYQMELRSSSDQIVWRKPDLRLPAGSQDDLVLTVEIPARAIPDGSYELAVRGGKTGVSLDDLGFIGLTVRWSP